MKANNDVNLESRSMSNSRSQSNASKQKQELVAVAASPVMSLKQAFAVKKVDSKPEFIPPVARTPLNPSQLAKRRFFG